MSSSAVAELTVKCLENDCPLPSFELIEKIDNIFIIECQIASLLRIGKGPTKSQAKESAAKEMLIVIQDIEVTNHETATVMELDHSVKKQDEDTSKKVLKYRQLADSDIKLECGTSIKDRHNFFKKKFTKDKRLKCHQIIGSGLSSDEDKVNQLLKELDIKSRKKFLPGKNFKQFTFVELICDYDVVFAGETFEVYGFILNYFKDML